MLSLLIEYVFLEICHTSSQPCVSTTTNKELPLLKCNDLIGYEYILRNNHKNSFFDIFGKFLNDVLD